jgi:dienelactone hydrolase
MITQRPITVHHDDSALEGEMALPDAQGRRPAVLVMSNAHGLGPQARERARLLAEQGYIAVATDMYGGGAFFPKPAGIAAPFAALHAAPEKLRARIVAWYDALRRQPEADPERIGGIGFCFGGQCVLELARSGCDVKAVVSYHGLLQSAMPARPGAITGQIVVYTGEKDPYVPHEHVEAFRNEMMAAGARWQLTVFGDAYHSFTDPDADPNAGVPGIRYDALADKLSWDGTLTLLAAALS